MTEVESARPARHVRVTRRHNIPDERVEVHAIVTAQRRPGGGNEPAEEIVTPIRVWMRPCDLEYLRAVGETIIGPRPGIAINQAVEGPVTDPRSVAGVTMEQITLTLDLEPTATPRRAFPGWGIRTVRNITI